MKTLNTIQTLAKVGRIISKIVFIFCIIGAVGTAVGIASVAVLGEAAIKIGGDSAIKIVQEEAEINIPTMMAAMITGLAVLIGEIFISKFAETYFKNELADGTPFTTRGANELKRLGIICIAVPLGTAVVCGLGLAVASVAVPSINMSGIEMSDAGSVGIGIAFLVVSLLCRLGAEKTEGNQDVAEAAAPAADSAE